MNSFLDIADRHHIIIMFVLFDDCWNDVYHAGTQPAPKTGVHNSGWLRDPGGLYFKEPLLKDTLEHFVKDILTTFRHDKRILLWDVCITSQATPVMVIKSLDLLEKCFRVSNRAIPIPCRRAFGHPISKTSTSFSLLTRCHLLSQLRRWKTSTPGLLTVFENSARPLICTEYMARTRAAGFQNIMPLKQNNVAAINWGFVSQKQTRFIHGIHQCPMAKTKSGSTIF